MKVHVGRQAQRAGAVPHAIVTVVVVIAGNDMPGDGGKIPHALQGLEQRLLRRGVIVVKIARHQHMGGTFGCRQAADLLDHGQARLAQHAFLVAEVPERLADLPVGGVDESHEPSMEARGPGVNRRKIPLAKRRTSPHMSGREVWRLPCHCC